MKYPCYLFFLVLSIALFGCSKNSRKNARISFYATNSARLPVNITLDDGQVIRLENEREQPPFNCTESNTTATLKISKGSHTIVWASDGGSNQEETIKIIDDCFLFKIGN